MQRAGYSGPSSARTDLAVLRPPPGPADHHQQSSLAHARQGEKLLTLAGYLGGSARDSAVVPAAPFYMQPAPPEHQVDVVELRRLMERSDTRHQDTFRLVLDRCYRTVRRVASVKKYACAFEVPEFVPGRPLYDVMRCIEFLVRNLTANGYAIQYVLPRTLLVSWHVVQTKQHDSVLRKIYEMQQRSVDAALKCQEKQQALSKQLADADVAKIPSSDALHAELSRAEIDAAATAAPSAGPVHVDTHAMGRTTTRDGLLPLPLSGRLAAAPHAPQTAAPDAPTHNNINNNAQQHKARARGSNTSAPGHNQPSQFKSISEFKPSGKFVLHM